MRAVGGKERPDEPMPASEVLRDVTPAQSEAIEHGSGPMLVLAGAGSGKTRVITRRIARLIERGVPARSILSITFTNKAAGEMAARVHALVGRAGSGGGRPWVSTFHSFCASLLRRDIVKLGYPREFTIYDEDDSCDALKEALRSVGAPESIRPRAARAAISRWKSALVGPDQAYAEAAGSGFRERRIAEAYRLYEGMLRSRAALDFDDLLLKTLGLLRVHDDVREKWRRRFRHLQVDEYQDTNRVQYEIVKLLAGEERNVAVVGDPDQSIYSWRGAEPRNIEDFARDFSGALVVRLGTNFRSRQAILDAASGLMSRAPGERAGELTGVRGEGERPRLVLTWSADDEAAEVSRRIGDVVRAGRPAREVAVFYRVNAQSRAFEQAFMERGVPYAVVGGVAFYQRKEVKDALAYLRVALNPADDGAFGRIVNTPRRGMGEKARGSFTRSAAERTMPLAEAARDRKLLAGLPERAAGGLRRLDRLLGRLRRLVRGPAGPAARAAVEETGLRAMYEGAGEDERVENLDELAAAALAFDETDPEGGLQGFLEKAALVADIDRWDERADRVALMTLHSAKGLEFPLVFIAGLADGILPHARSLDGGEGALDEERRLLYVGMTRARDELVLSCSRSCRRGARSRLAVRSRFLDEIPPSALVTEDLAGEGEVWESRARPGLRRRFRRRRSHDGFTIGDEAKERSLDEERAIRRALDEIEEGCAVRVEPGDRVDHPEFGAGKVVAVRGAGEEARVTVDFSRVGRKTVVLGRSGLTRR
jgi:DNA helicase-2/ATP-dependent DNA helicase PcrA